MAIYYIDTQNGSERNNGLSQSSPISDYKKIELLPGDTVLFKRGSFIREKLYAKEGTAGIPITYGAYGDGEMPTFCGSVDMSDEAVWTNESGNIWYCNLENIDEAANFVFDDGMCGTLRWTKEQLCEQGDFFDNCFGYVEKGRKIGNDHRIYLYSKKNPASMYRSIECVVYGSRNLADNGHNIVYQDLKFINSGVHAIAGLGRSRNLKVSRCHFCKIGGAVWDYEKKIRFGNGVELWNVGENVEISYCIFDDIYDSATTHQGGADCEPAKNVVIKNNVFKNCGMAAFEQRDLMPEGLEFSENICIDAGKGFSKNGIELPRYSEIWPEPMGHHIFLWRIDKASKNSKMNICNNIFYDAPFGAAVYSIISKDAEDKTLLDGNTYFTSGDGFIAKWNNMTYNDFDNFADVDKNGKYDKVDICKILKAWEESYK